MAFAEMNEFRMHYEVLGAEDFRALALVHDGLSGGR